MQSSKRLRNLIVIVFIFLVINFVTLTNISSEDKKPMIVLKEYYYYSFGDIEIRDPRDLDETQLKKFEFERVNIKSRILYKFIGKNDTDYEIYLGDVFVSKSKKTADLELITVKEYENPENIDFNEIIKILYDKKLIELRGIALKAKFIEKGIEGNGGGGYSSYYKLPLIYCMIENCNIGTSEDKRILDVSNFKDEKNITEGPYSAQNEKGQIIVWTALEKHILPGEGDKNADNFLYIVNAYKRESSYGGGFNVDRTFMRGSIDRLVRDFKKNYCNRDIEESEKRGNYFISKIEAIIEDPLAKWTVIPFLWARYKGYRYLHETKRDYFSVTSGIFPEKTKIEFEYDFVQEFGTEENTVKNIINSQIDHIYEKVKQSHENYEKGVIENYKSKMLDFDSIYFSIAAIWGVIIGLITFFWKISYKFWLGNRKKKKIAHFTTLIRLVVVAIIFFVVYILLYDIFVIHNVNIEEPSILITRNEKILIVLISLAVTSLWTLWNLQSWIKEKIPKLKL